MDELYKIDDYELLNQKVCRILKTRIVKGDLKPGEKLLEIKIAKQLGVSRTPVREALKQLSAEGFLKMNPNLGAVVVEFSLEDIREVLQIRRALEGLAASIAAEKSSKEETTKLEEIIEKMSNCVSKNDITAYSDLNGEFHNLIFSVCGNKRLIKICNNLSNSEQRFKIRSLRGNLGRLKYSLKEHQEIVKALKRRDAEQAGKLSQIHIDKVLKNILENESKKKYGKGKDEQN